MTLNIILNNSKPNFQLTVFWNLIAVIVFAAKDEEALRNEPGMSDPGVYLGKNITGFLWQTIPKILKVMY